MFRSLSRDRKGIMLKIGAREKPRGKPTQRHTGVEGWKIFNKTQNSRTMKRLSIILTGVLFAASISGLVRAQAPFDKYKTTVTTGAQDYPALSASATILWEPAEGTALSKMLLLSETERVSVNNGSKYPATVNFGQEMTFGGKKFLTAGIVADGFVFFGSHLEEGDTQDSICPTIDGVYQMAANRDFMYSAFLSADGWSAAPSLLAGEGAKIGYEIKDGVLYIGYENIQVKTSEGQSMVCSWNYALHLATGEIVLHTKDFSPTENMACQYSFALAASVDFQNPDALWLATWSGQTSTMMRSIALSSTSKPNDSVYHFNLPAACGQIGSFVVSWDENSSSVEGERINIGMPSWNEGEKALFILSEESTLTGESLPQNGVLYNDNSKIGNSVGVRIGGRDMMGCYVSGVFEDLKPGTTYYVYAFGYNDSCSGAIYSSPQTRSYTTLMGAPDAEGISVSDVALNTLKINLPSAETGLSYVVAVSEGSLVDLFSGEAYGGMLTDGTKYQQGQTIEGDFGLYAFTVKETAAAAGQHEIDGLKEGTPYNIAVWYKGGTEETPTYSFRPVVVGARTVTRIPAKIDFENEAVGTQPVGWQISKEGDEYGFEVRSYGESGGGIDIGGVVLSDMAKASQSVSRLLVSQLDYILDDSEFETAPDTKTLRSHAITPVFRKGDVSGLTAIFNLAFLTRTSSEAPETAYRLQDGDSVVVSWAESQDAETWTRLTKIDKSVRLDGDGFVTIPTSVISPASDFCYKLEYFHLADKSNDAPAMFAVAGFEIEEDLPCKYVSDIVVAEDQVDATAARLTWKDGNEGTDVMTQSFLVAYRTSEQEEWDTVKPYPTATEYLLEGLQPGKTYNVSIQAVCGDKGNSLVRGVEFLTMRTIPYTIDIHELKGDGGGTPVFPDELTNGKGTLTAGPTPDPENGWVVALDKAYYPDLLLRLAIYSNTWLTLPTLVATENAVVNITADVFNYGIVNDQWVKAEAAADTLWVFASENGKFGPQDRQIAGFIPLKDLVFEIEEITGDDEGFTWTVESPKYNAKTVEFEVQAGKKYTFAYYIPGVEATALPENIDANNLIINKISITYGSIVYPAVTNLHTENLGKTNVTVVWEGSADSYVVKYKPRREERFDSVTVQGKSVDLIDLEPGTAYEYMVYGIYGGVAGKVSSTMFFNTIAECVTPQDFAIVREFWDGARITAHSENKRMIHIVSAGEVGEYFINTVIEWESAADTLRLRGLALSGANYPYNVRVRAVCSPGDSSAWTETLTFHTTELPEVGLPTNLRADYQAANRTAVLSWTPGVNNDYTYVYYQKVGSKADTTLTNRTSYTLMDLETNAVYKWSLQPLYDTYILGGRTEEQSFTAVGNERREYANALRIRMNQRQIVVENPENRYIRLIRVYDLSGRVLKTYPVNDKGNVFVNTDLGEGMVLVEVIGSGNERASLKAIVM